MQDKKLVDVIFEAIDETNQLLPKEHQIKKSLQFRLIDGSKRLDSLNLVNLIVAIETKIEENFNITISLIDGLAKSRSNEVFKTVGSLIEYIGTILRED